MPAATFDLSVCLDVTCVGQVMMKAISEGGASFRITPELAATLDMRLLPVEEADAVIAGTYREPEEGVYRMPHNNGPP